MPKTPDFRRRPLRKSAKPDAPDLRPTEERLKEARNLAHGRISRRETSARELERWLNGRGVAVLDAQEIIAHLIEQGYVDDRRFAGILVRELIRQGKGPRVIQQKLLLKGIRLAEDDLKSMMSTDRDGGPAATDIERAKGIIERRYPEYKTDRAEAQRAYQALIRRGFSFDVARRALER